jgi:predicted metallo-beta-lactamase superfamily hydrolase
LIVKKNTENKQANIVVNNPSNNEANPGNSGEQKLENIEMDTLDETVAETIVNHHFIREKRFVEN